MVFYHGDPVTRYNMKLQHYSEKLVPHEALKVCAEMKAKGVRPNQTTYTWLISALASNAALYQECWAAFLDMKAMGFTPDILIFNQLLRSVRTLTSGESLKVIQEMQRHGVQPDSRTHDLLIQRYAEGENIEVALRRLTEMEDAGFSPSLKTAEVLVSKIAETGFPRLALDLATAFEHESVRRLSSETWVALLASSAQNSYPDGMVPCWNKVVKDLSVVPDEGLCIDVLHASATHGLPVLASEVLKQLEKLKIPLREHHILPLLDAFANNGDIKEAFRVLDLMRTSGSAPTIDTAQSIFKAIQRDPDAIDSAFTKLQEVKDEGHAVDATGVNVIIQAAGFLNDLQRAVGTYKAMSSLDVKPDVTTFNLLLAACVSAQHRELGDRMFAEMGDAHLKPNVDTYKQLVALHLTQPEYEDAFFYLEEMKSAGLKPPYSIYDNIVRKCVSMGDSRYKLAVEELEQMEYTMTPDLITFIDSGGSSPNPNRSTRS
ncbi:hypothetical protein SCHPADRAFT_854109 [Schizopora paradoxa]|uniref:Pentatricopeptide repeat-containing protein-mitochondrial domain-containing protein n=1 Tax=Schizopora paradoxa TaxID=27342 RepID=A0A0H2RK38_9AGAM|nr:hypothetical protein SCHPADRAFT_854109 [Schizopora paradoxa]